MEDTTVIDRRARVIATLRRRSPPSMFSGPNRCSTRPCRSCRNADGQHDVVTLVALHALEVLHEERLGTVLVEELEHVVVHAGERAPQRLVDPRGVRAGA